MSGVQDTAQEGGKEHLAFIALPTNYEQNAEVNSGQIASADPFQSNDGSSAFGAKQFLNSKGLGWLLEHEETDEDPDSQLPLLEELDINPAEILYKVRCVLLPFKFDRSVLLSNPDFWGPMAVVLTYSLLIIWGQLRVVSWILTMWMLGSFLIFALGRVLGAEITFSQVLGVIGYSVLPLNLAVLIISIIPEIAFSIIVRVLCTFWAAFSAGTLLAQFPQEKMRDKQIMLSYPILLLFIYFISLCSGV